MLFFSFIGPVGVLVPGYLNDKGLKNKFAIVYFSVHSRHNTPSAKRISKNNIYFKKRLVLQL